MKYDITKTPPSSDELIEQREKYTKRIDKIRRLEKQANWITLTVILAVILMFFYIIFLDDLYSLSVVVAVALVAILVVGGALDYFERNFIKKPKAHAKKELRSLFELEASYNPSQCIQFLKWCQKDDTLKAYQHQLAKMGRTPVIGEYLAAEQWIKSMELNKAKEQDQREANEACEQLKQPV